MTLIQKRNLLKISVFGVTGMLIIFACIQAYFLYGTHQEHLHKSQRWAEQQTQSIAQDLSSKISYVATIADELADSLSDARCSPCHLEAQLKSFYLKHSDFTSLGLAFDAAKSGTEFRLYAPFIRTNSVGAAIERLDSYYDYLAPQNIHYDDLQRVPESWYSAAQQHERQWLTPFYDVALDTHVIRYTAPLFNKSKEKIGLVFVDISLEWLSEQIEHYDLKDNNYLGLYTQQGQELYYSLKGIRQITKQLANNTVIKAENSAGINILTGDSVWHNRELLAATQWILQTTISANTSVAINGPPTVNGLTQELDNTDALKGRDRSWHILAANNPVAWVSLLVMIGILFFSCLRLLRKRTSELQLWFDTAVYTCIFSLGVVTIWFFEYGSIASKPANTTVLANKAIVEKYERDHALSSLASHDKAPTYVPVGLFIQSIEFLSASNVNITGYIWHRYQEGQESDYAVGTIFPEAITTNISVAYEETNQGETLKGWYFETTLRENFSPDKFPLDRQSVWIRLWHEKLGENIVLVPDFLAYDSLNTRSLPGIEKDFVLSGWSLYRSYFEMRENNYNTRLGAANSSSGGAVPELYFNIEIMRNFINPFLAHLFPLLVVVLMLYAIVITMSTDHEKKDFLGFNAAGVVASCSALFFVALIAHVQMRNELAANSVVYLEYFYLITYVVILLITTNAVLLSLNVKIWFIQFHDNLLPKLIYWPALTAALFLCTVWTFR